jgi:hypothetical protein
MNQSLIEEIGYKHCVEELQLEFEVFHDRLYYQIKMDLFLLMIKLDYYENERKVYKEISMQLNKV